MKQIKKGFTLIELLIVIAIIGILASVILVSTSSAQNKAKNASARSSLRSALTYMVLCVNGGSTVKAYAASGDVCTDNTVTDAKWPSMGTNCSAAPSVAGTVVSATCGGTAISCDASTGSCT